MFKYKSNKQHQHKIINNFATNNSRNSNGNIQQNVLDDFKKPDGFRGRSTPNINQHGAIGKPITYPQLEHRTAMPFAIDSHKSKKHKVRIKTVIKTILTVTLLVLLICGFIYGKQWWNAHGLFK